jgi:hypothetical protein
MFFGAVAPNIKLEQSIQRAAKSHGGIISIMSEWQIIFHEILLIANNLGSLLNDKEALDLIEF